jgi:hypothetical protein
LVDGRDPPTSKTETERSPMAVTEYKPGDEVPKSGIYKVVHDNKHAEEHEVTCIIGKKFSPCNHCSNGVRFTLVRAAHHIDNHDEFKKKAT